ncbi:MAG: tungstate ABC transporter substrate-binding protein WtpA [Methanomicrobia archaeon]|nr:tungstate ABC transporter substrate-binding protein WtpA [Methanomicrobia archaeon]
MKYHIAMVLIAAVVLSAACISPAQEKSKVKVIYAGSLIIPFEEMEKAFESAHPDVDVLLEGHGSIQAIRHITEIHEEYDVLAVADDSLVPDMMYPEYADWYVRFATNQMVIAYTDKSLYADEINESNWYEILARPDAAFGFSNPMFDACGYRTLMVVPLAELYYEDDTIFDEVIGSNFEPPIPMIEENCVYTVVAPEVFEPRGDKLAIRGGSVQLLALLEYGGIDYAFEYKSVAEQHELRYVELPPEIDLSSPEYSENYKKAKVNLGFQRFSSVDIERIGRPIFYGITVPKNAPNPELGQEFVNFVLSEEGQRVLRSTNQPTIPSEADNVSALPEELRTVVTKEIEN